MLIISVKTHVVRCHKAEATGRVPLLFFVDSECVRRYFSELYCVSKKFPPLNYLQLRRNLNRFSQFCTAGKRMKFPLKPIQNYPPRQFRYVAKQNKIVWRTMIVCSRMLSSNHVFANHTFNKLTVVTIMLFDRYYNYAKSKV